jgi:hypothetical protein
MPDDHGQTAAGIIQVLHAAGLRLALNADGDLDITGPPKALRVWEAMSVAVADLGDVVIAALTRAAAPVSDTNGTAPVTDHDTPDPLASWRRMGDGAGTMVERLTGGSPRPAPAPASEAVPTPPKHGPLPEPPRTDSGYPYIDGAGHAWRARRNAARARGQEFTEPPPYKWPFN